MLTTFAPFNPAAETWDLYIMHFDFFLEANDYIEPSSNHKKPFFLSFCGAEMSKTVRALLAPLTIQSVPWETMLVKLQNHYVSLHSRIARHHAFHHWNQVEGESINQYMAAQRTAVLYCYFMDLDDVLLDQLVCGVRDFRLQHRLLTKTDLTLQTALDEA